MNCEGLSDLTHSLKIVIRNNFLECRKKQVNIFARRNIFHTLFIANKAKRIPNMYISRFCEDPIYSKSIKKILKKSHFLKNTIFLLIFSKCKDVSRASNNLKEGEIVTNLLICQIMVVN